MKKLNIGPQSIQELLKKLPAIQKRRLIVVGDSGLDEYVFGKVRRISPEAPVPVVEVTSSEGEEARLGLSTNVAQNISSLGGTALLVSVVGADETAGKLKNLLQTHKVSSEYLIEDSSRPTTRKLRVMAGQHHIVRVDYEHQRFLSDAIQTKVLKMVERLLPESDGVIIQDYAKGVISETLVEKICGMAKTQKKLVFGDPHRTTPLATYRGVDLMTPNYDEAVTLSGLAVSDLRSTSETMEEVAHKILAETRAERLVITRGKDGMTLYNKNEITHIPTFARSVFDVTGAGDTVIAALAMAYTGGLPLEEACLIGNFAAGFVVGKVGCVPCGYQDLVGFMQGHA